ncbi:MAG TPA: hypothetical protein VE710_05145 [Candidatus Bathyarchaeia archaeon]|uniref:hypothetical protein n=1 Tax=Brevibacillus migulae TaxID=1644114 RepID=UPI00106ED6D4|nr:hypothetical protein [Brevibacillus migulae]HZG14393.1 hypothetical protein [Candidatus Bathyarchaeia archaeon]
MGPVLLVISLFCIAVGTWKLIGMVKERKPGSKPLWAAVTIAGIVLFLLLKLLTELDMMA